MNNSPQEKKLINSQEELELIGVREKNLKNFNLKIPHDKFVVITGLSGSGKSSLAFDTIYTEGARRYIETFSQYTRQFLDRLRRPDIDNFLGIRPALALEQRNRTTSSRSTVGTVTEINDYLKVIWASLADVRCPSCKELVKRDTNRDILKHLQERVEIGKEQTNNQAERGQSRSTINSKKNSKNISGVLITFSIKLKNDFRLESLIDTLLSQALIRYYDPKTKTVGRLEELKQKLYEQSILENSASPEKKSKVEKKTKETAKESSKHKNLQASEIPVSDATMSEIIIVVDRINFKEGLVNNRETKERLNSSLTQAYSFGKGKLNIIYLDEYGEYHDNFETFSEALECTKCQLSFVSPKPAFFSYNSPLGACPTCQGFGRTLEIDPSRCVPNPHKSIKEGAIVPWSFAAAKQEFKKLLEVCKALEIDVKSPWINLSEREKKIIFEGPKFSELKPEELAQLKTHKYKGLLHWFSLLAQKRHKMHVRIFIARFRSEQICKICQGTRLITSSSYFELMGCVLPRLWQMSFKNALRFFEEIPEEKINSEVVETALNEVKSRLSYLIEIGLDYLTLDRQTKTLSGGEYQRVNLTGIIGSRLVNTTIVLDEPTIGLHPRDTNKLIGLMKKISARGNTVLVVEHDNAVISQAEEIIDIGPYSGHKGGEVIFQGTFQDLLSSHTSLTAKYLRGEYKFKPKPFLIPIEPSAPHLELQGVSEHNLKNINVKIPLEKFVVITGVSGSGKSTLVKKSLFETVEKFFQGYSPENIFVEDAKIKNLKGFENITGIELIDQSPVGKTPRSNPATYTKAWDIIREILASTEEATRLGLSKSSFSFNVDGGRCPVCKGAGSIKVEMQFLADVFVECESCLGKRFQDALLNLKYNEKNVNDILQMSISEAWEFFSQAAASSPENSQKIKKLGELFQPLLNLGLGYLKLGHPLSELSGGEAQRLKIASFLNLSSTKKSSSSKYEDESSSEEFEGKKIDGNEKILFILDEPTTGLHPHNIKQLIIALQSLLEKGHSVICVEHNLDLILQADWMVELGPGGGDDGGEVVLEGVPQKLLNDKKINTATISYLREHLQGNTGSLKLVSSNTPENTAEKNIAEVSLAEGASVTTAKDKQSLALTKATKNIKKVSYEVQDTKLPTINIFGAKEHNLKNISLSIPKNSLTVVCGVSGSGKSSLAFDIVFAEGQRRFIDCLSPYARQFIQQLKRADVDLVESLPPTIAVSQKTAPPLGTSTVATVTEVYQYLRLLFAKTGTQYCPKDNAEVSGFSKDSIVASIIADYKDEVLYFYAPVVSGRKGSYGELFQRAIKAEITEAKIDGKILNINPSLKLERHKTHWVSLLVGSIKHPEKNIKLVEAAVEQCLSLGSGTLELAVGNKNSEPRVFSTERVCRKCNTAYHPLDPQDFSFRSSRGVCGKCQGKGYLENTNGDQKICPECEGSRIKKIARFIRINNKNIFEFTNQTPRQLLASLKDLKFSKQQEQIAKPLLMELISRLSVIDAVGLDYLNLNREASSISGGEAQRLRLAKTLGSPLTGICYVLDEPSIGLHPLDQELLNKTLFQLRDIGNTVIVVEHDEDTIRMADHLIEIGPGGGDRGGNLVFSGLPKDIPADSPTGMALKLREKNNKVIKAKTPKKLTESIESEHLRGEVSQSLKVANSEPQEFISFEDVSVNNLKNISVKFPLNSFVVVAGVSGAGKSSLVHQTISSSIARNLAKRPTRFNSKGKASENSNIVTTSVVTGRANLSLIDKQILKCVNLDKIKRLVEIDQSPLGKTSTSCPASFLGIFDNIRKIFAEAIEAKARGWKANFFSYNTGKGRCPACEGKGFLKVPMSFLPDAVTTCESCLGLRYQDSTLEVLYLGHSIAEVLKMTMAEARDVFINHRQIRTILEYVNELGLGYFTLGQPTFSLSGGEAQRLKIVREFGSSTASNTLYILDEPTIGLHMNDVDKLTSVLKKLVEKGNTVLVIEHNLDILREADWLIELGPGPGEKGGEITFMGTIEQLKTHQGYSATKNFL